MTALNIGDTVRWCDDIQSRGTVLKVSDQPRRHWTGKQRDDLPRMVFVQWNTNRYGRTPGRMMWEPPELLTRIES
jgi:hypothetical protein